jgi:hypothetical protein
MDHDATREQLELAAAEPGGLDRLMAGDTPSAQAVAAHLAGCPSCTDELERLDRASRLIRQVLRERPPAKLWERTLATVQAAGVQRNAGAAAASSTPAISTAPSGVGGRLRSALGWVGAVAAAVVISVVATSAIVGWRVDDRLASQAHTIEALEDVSTATFQLSAEPDARRVALAGTDPGLAGNIIFSPSTSQLVVVATGLTEPSAGQEYRCWVEQAGQRERVGKMFFSEHLAYWIGPAPAVEGLVDGATFGVSLVDVEDTATDSETVLGGGL